ncbi:MAG TPA: helix-turn-helix transcriptional regulator [Thermoanaerobaculia bacterium]|nr:helix-turn-helix transcriptional regulator [Thermoanaerobaculia bacterium]
MTGRRRWKRVDRASRDRARDPAGTPLRPVEFLVLAVLLDGPAHGYGLVGEIEERTAGAVSPRPGDLYRVLFRMQERGWLERCEPVAEQGDGDDRRRTDYRITELGRRVVGAEAAVLSAVSRGVIRCLAESGEPG